MAGSGWNGLNMSDDQPKPLDTITNWALATGGKPVAAGLVCALSGIALISTTYAVPERYEHWFQVPCLVLFLYGAAKIIWAVTFPKKLD